MRTKSSLQPWYIHDTFSTKWSLHSEGTWESLKCKIRIFLLVGTLSIDIPTIADKIVETLFLNRVILENKRIRTPPLSPPFKVGVFVVFYRQLEQGHNIAQRGWGRKAIFPPFEVNKTQKKNSFGRSVSTHFVADCSFKICWYSWILFAQFTPFFPIFNMSYSIFALKDLWLRSTFPWDCGW